MKIFEITIQGETDWVVAASMFEAIKWYLNDTGNAFSDLDDVCKLSKADYFKHEVIYDDGKQMTFAEALEEDERMPPYHLASTANL